jgi:hypothetical protein
MLYLVIWMVVLGFHGAIPGADAAGRVIEDFMASSVGGGGPDLSQQMEMDPLVTAAVAVPYWAALKIAFGMLTTAGKAGQGRENEKDWMDE